MKQRFGRRLVCTAMLTISLMAGCFTGLSGCNKDSDTKEKQDLLVREGIENLTDRALLAIDLAGDKGAEEYVTATDSNGNEYTKGVYLSWRAFEEDPEDVTFTLYRNNEVIATDLTVTNCIDEGGKYGDIYHVEGSSDSELGISAYDTAVWENYYQELTLNLVPEMGLPLKQWTEYTANDMSIGDLDGDGRYELVLKWYPDVSKDNSQTGPTGYTYLDAYDIDYATGEVAQMWRINLGPNIRSGAHYTQFMVWDMNNDGVAEVACKTADATTTYCMTSEGLSETGHVGACNVDEIVSSKLGKHEYDFRNGSGHVLDGPEYLTIFNGATGQIIDTAEYIPGRGTITEFGDGGGNRSERYLACVAYLDGVRPCMVFCRGYYAKTCLTAYYLDENNKLQILWTFNSDELIEKGMSEFEKNYNAEVEAQYKAELTDIDFSAMNAEEIKETITKKYKQKLLGMYTGQGNHNLSVADIDGDEKDEIIYGALTIDDDGSYMYSTGLGHGDAIHVGDFVEDNEGLEVFSVHENPMVQYTVDLRDAHTGEFLFAYKALSDVGRGMAGDIDPRYPGAEYWSWADSNVYSSQSNMEELVIVSDNCGSINFDILWDGDLLTELQDHNFDNGAYAPRATNITDWDYEKGESVNLLYSSEILTGNGSKGNVCLVADFLGDWREEIIARCANDRSKVRIYATTLPTDYVIPCLLQDETYRLGIAWQNVAYNQPAHLGYNLTEGLRVPIVTLKAKASGITVSFTQANDGIYGSDIEGYEIYRADDGSDNYELIATLDADTLKYKDKNVDKNGKYSYKVASIVNGKTSYFSLPVSNE